MSPKAYQIYDYLAKQRKASSVVSQVLVNWDMDHTPTLQFGDVRTMPNGDKCVWTENGWMIQVEAAMDPIQNEPKIRCLGGMDCTLSECRCHE